MTYMDPMLPRMSSGQLKLLVQQASGLISENQGPEEAREHLAAVSLTLPVRRPRMIEITTLVAERYGLTVEEIRGSSRRHGIAHPRQEAMALIYAMGRLSLPQIGAFFHRDHTTVLHGIRAHTRRQADNLGIAAE